MKLKPCRSPEGSGWASCGRVSGTFEAIIDDAQRTAAALRRLHPLAGARVMISAHLLVNARVTVEAGDAGHEQLAHVLADHRGEHHERVACVGVLNEMNLAQTGEVISAALTAHHQCGTQTTRERTEEPIVVRHPAHLAANRHDVTATLLAQ